MPVKKGSKKKKSGKKKRLKSAPVEKEDVKAENMEPGSLISGTQTDPLLASNGKKSKKKKGKKKKLTKAEKALEKLEKATQKIKDDEESFYHLINRMDQWLRSMAPRAIELFKMIDTSGDGILSYDEFKSGMFDLNIPLNRTELHLMARLLDTDDSGEIDYTEFSKGITYVKPVDETSDPDPDHKTSLILSERKPVPCSCCKMGVWQPYREKNPRYLSIELRLVTFDNYKDHLGHISVLVHSHLSIYGLIELIINQTSVLSTKLAIFSDKSRSLEALLPVESTLEDCGYFGSSRENPQEITLYYDYTVEFVNCPLLMCDHYFGQKLEV
ncbi:hypothetical protein SNE40_017922 [Patella caerulea]|uniref:EF-hand domain-containing protein n=1 Tax=Patella caerulea TaxID=87958 RepID=A0AAN8JBC6_PATCE